MTGKSVDTRFIALNSGDLEWVSGAEIQELPPPGPEVKILRHFPGDDNALDLLVRFPPGYVEPRHTHSGEHMVFILQGRMLVDGKTLGPGDYVYGPRDEPHGPFEYPDGILLYASHRGDTAHEYEGKDQVTNGRLETSR
jgi:quercetin dioxygenase-like cupin family protein